MLFSVLGKNWPGCGPTRKFGSCVGVANDRESRGARHWVRGSERSSFLQLCASRSTLRPTSLWVIMTDVRSRSAPTVRDRDEEVRVVRWFDWKSEERDQQSNCGAELSKDLTAT